MAERLLGDVWLVSGRDHTHPWDASAYLIPGDEPTLIDCGGSLGYPALKAALQRFGYQPGDITRIIGTHGHWDHLAAAAALQAEGSAELLLHEADRAQVEAGDYDRTAAFLYDQPFPPARVTGNLHEGEVLRLNGLEFTVYHTPGHTAGSICLLGAVEGQRLLISGDTVWGGCHPRIGSDMEAWARSLDRLVALDFDVMTMGHWHKLITGAKDKVERARLGFGRYFNPWFDLEGRGF